MHKTVFEKIGSYLNSYKKQRYKLIILNQANIRCCELVHDLYESRPDNNLGERLELPHTPPIC
jgi:predicted secreted protein